MQVPRVCCIRAHDTIHYTRLATPMVNSILSGTEFSYAASYVYLLEILKCIITAIDKWSSIVLHKT